MMGMRVLESVGRMELTVLFLQFLAFLVTYHVWTGKRWRDTAEGRFLMAICAAFAAVLAMSMMRLIIVDVMHAPDPPWFYALRMAVFLAPVIMMARLQWVLYRQTHPSG